MKCLTPHMQICTHLLVVCQGPDEAQANMLSGEDNKTRGQQPLLPGQEVQHLHHTLDSLRLNKKSHRLIQILQKFYDFIPPL